MQEGSSPVPPPAAPTEASSAEVSSAQPKVRSRSFKRRQQRKAAADRKPTEAPDAEKSAASELTKALCAAALAAKAAYETAYESAELRGGSELNAKPVRAAQDDACAPDATGAPDRC